MAEKERQPSQPAIYPVGQFVGTRSLASVRDGEIVVIRHILFGSLRDLCQRTGFQEGDVVRCRLATPSHLLLELPNGHTVPCARDWARFIRISPPKDPQIH